jgi:hypothetical protein
MRENKEVSKIDWLTEQMRHNLETLKGVKVTREHGDARRKICNNCEFKSKVFFSDTCGLCKCPLSIKPYFLNHIFSAANIMVQRDEENKTRVICPHKEGNKWEQIDTEFLIKNIKK